MKRGIKILGIVLALLLTLAIAAPLLLDANQFRPLLQNKLSAALGREVTLGGLHLSIFSGSVTASDLSIADDPAFSKSPFLRASSLQAGIELMPLIFSRKLNITRITVDQPQIDLVQNPAGVWNFSSIGAKSAPAQTSGSAPSLSVAKIKISNGRVTVAKAASQSQPLILDKLNIEVKDFSADSPFTFSLTAALSGAGTVKLYGKVGPINAGNAIATPLNANLHVAHLDLGASGAVNPALGIDGIASIDGNVSSNGTAVEVAGKLQGEHLSLVKAGAPATRPLEVDFALDHNLTTQSGTIKRGDIHLGNAIAALTGAYSMAGEVPELNLKLAGSNLDVTELGAFLPALDVVLPPGAAIEQGTAQVNFTAEGPADNLVAVGTVGLDSVRLANFDLATKLSVLDELAGLKPGPHTEIQTFHATLKFAPDGTEVQEFDLLIPSIGHITGTGRISPAHELAFKMRAALHSAMGAIAGLGSKDGIPFTVSGTSQSPSFKANVKSLATDKVREVKDLTGGLFHKKKQQQKEDPQKEETPDP